MVSGARLHRQELIQSADSLLDARYTPRIRSQEGAYCAEIPGASLPLPCNPFPLSGRQRRQLYGSVRSPFDARRSFVDGYVSNAVPSVAISWYRPEGRERFVFAQTLKEGHGVTPNAVLEGKCEALKDDG